jgi:hypothetical protein
LIWVFDLLGLGFLKWRKENREREKTGHGETKKLAMHGDALELI